MAVKKILYWVKAHEQETIMQEKVEKI